jgi:PAS domain S-box-containing protein
MNGLFSHYRFIAIAIWLAAVASSFTWNIVDDVREKNDVARVTARTFFEQIIASRRWNLMHGGVYVYTTDDSPPNIYLPEGKRQIRDDTGRSLTLINPSYMTRQIAAISKAAGQVGFHITSLTPLRPENKPYPWEIPWLRSFDQGVTEQSAFISLEGKEVYHYMAPLPQTKSCLPCHHTAADIEGMNRGGISISLPIIFHKSTWPLILSHLLVALTGIFGILFFGRHLSISRRIALATNKQLKQEIKEHKRTEAELINTQENLEAIVDYRTTELQKTNETLDKKVAEQLKIEAALVAINDEFIQIFNSAPDGMHVIDRDFNVIRVNRAYCKLTGKKMEEIQGHKCYEVFTGKLCHTDKCPLTQISKGAERIEVEARKVHPDGSIIPCIVTATPFREPGGKLTGIIEVTRDASNWKRIEQSLSATAEHLRARNTELEDFAHVISHDLQEPLMLIQAFSDRIRTKFGPSLPKKGIAYLERIESSTTRMQSLIDGLLLYSRVSSKALPFEDVSINTIIASVLEDLAIRIEKTQAHIIVEPTLPTIEADPLQMRQLFQNLIGNSLKYTSPDRRTTITIGQQHFPDQYNNQTYVRLVIEDNGIGFKEEHQEQIFDIFQRLHTRKQFQGTGIGLSICKKIIQHHKGTISAEGIPDQGAKFCITLPLFHQALHTEQERDNTFIDVVMNRR